jgi:endo-1,4-beta-mannosidase
MMKKCRINITLITLCLLLISCAGQEETSHDIWPEEKAFAWYEAIGPIKGFNYVPSTAINSTDMWQDITFDIETIDRELSWAKEAGYNSARVFLQYIVWEDNPKGLKERIDQYLEVADNHGISTMFILFDDCRQSGKDPYLGIQDDPVPGVHNGGWTPSPGSQKVTDKSVWPSLEEYVKDIVGTYKDDSRVIVWDLYNEPGNAGMGMTSLPLVEAAFKWAREAGPSQPLTSGPYGDFTNIFYRNSQMTKHLFDLSDIISFHIYQVPSEVRRVGQYIALFYGYTLDERSDSG